VVTLKNAIMSNTKVILITGASSGIGLVTARYLVQQGHHVYGTSRQPAQARADGFTLLALDVRSDDSIQNCVNTVIAEAGRLDVLINNAGFIGPGAASEELSLEQIKALFDTNFFGVIQMTNAVLPIMRQQGHGQIINLSSAAGLLTTPFFSVYAASKHALEGYTEGVRYEVRPFHIRVSLVEPGFLQTPIAQTIESPDRALEVYAARRQQAVALDCLSIQHGRDPIIVAQAIDRIIRSRSPRLRYAIGLDAQVMTTAKRLLPGKMVEHFISWLFLHGTEHQPKTSLTGLRRLFLGSRTADAAWRQTWRALALGAVAALIFGLWRNRK
jgi:NAD(P)-dependent dehydrogenase (short-subunit alcohol dehydrogenase family)